MSDLLADNVIFGNVYAFVVDGLGAEWGVAGVADGGVRGGDAGGERGDGAGDGVHVGGAAPAGKADEPARPQPRGGRPARFSRWPTPSNC